MNPYPFLFTQSPLLKQSYFGKSAKRINWKEYGKQRLMSISIGEKEIHLNVDASQKQFFITRKHLSRDGLDVINGTWKDVCLPKSYSKLCYQMSEEMRKALLSETIPLIDKGLTHHCLHLFSTRILYAQASGMNQAKKKFLDVVQQKLDMEFPGYGIECEWLPAPMSSPTELLLHMEAPEFASKSFSQSVWLCLKTLDDELNQLLGKEMAEIRKDKSKNKENLTVLVHDGLLYEDYIRDYDFAPGHPVFEIKEHGLAIGIECLHFVQDEGYQLFQIYSELNGKKKKVLEEHVSGFSQHSTFNFRRCVEQLEVYAKKFFEIDWHDSLCYGTFESVHPKELIEGIFHENLEQQLLDTFDLSIWTTESKFTSSYLTVFNDQALVENAELRSKLKSCIESSFKQSFKRKT